LTWGTYLATDIFTWGATVGLGFELPTDTKVFLSQLHSDDLHRRDRRQVFTKIKILLDEKGRDGRSCILKAVCEAASGLPKGSFLDALFKAIFRYLFFLRWSCKDL
jgi:DM4/DM12 family